ncbi:MAG: hypothetical protein H0T57_12870 [Rubrobacter sp.]|nr:hypothetical protein [Rubrobacter sp.]
MSLKILTYAAASAAVLALAVGVGVMAAFTLGSDDGGSSEGAKPERVEGESPEQGSRSQEDAGEKASDAPGDAAYSNDLAGIQNRAVEASLESNDKLLRYDGITAEDVEEMEANYTVLEGYSRRARGLAPPAKYEVQHNVFVRAIGELRDADELAYRLAADPPSATQTDFEAYDRHMDKATAYLRRSNEMLGEDYKTTGAAQEVGYY